ncbi:hypothetical protein [Kribbella deserti]|uniref:YCII-related domain-containing protein n=1 Tax=Kribbella deserti TaxID=1926257 RepID=A0ABV6QCY5_9ACTN
MIDKNDPDQYVEIRGTGVVTEDEGRAVAVALAELYDGPGAGEEYAALPAMTVRTVIRITPTRLTGPAST